MWPGCLTFLAEVCVALGDAEQAAVLYRELEPYRGVTMMVGFTICLGPAERLMGSLAALMCRRDDAERHFVAAFDLADQSGSPVWLAQVQHDWAAALGDRKDLAAAAQTTAARLGHGESVPTLRPAPRPVAGLGAAPVRQRLRRSIRHHVDLTESATGSRTGPTRAHQGRSGDFPGEAVTRAKALVRPSELGAPSAGFEPAHTAPEADALSPELRGRDVTRRAG